MTGSGAATARLDGWVAAAQAHIAGGSCRSADGGCPGVQVIGEVGALSEADRFAALVEAVHELAVARREIDWQTGAKR